MSLDDVHGVEIDSNVHPEVFFEEHNFGYRSPNSAKPPEKDFQDVRHL